MGGYAASDTEVNPLTCFEDVGGVKSSSICCCWPCSPRWRAVRQRGRDLEGQENIFDKEISCAGTGRVAGGEGWSRVHGACPIVVAGAQ